MRLRPLAAACAVSAGIVVAAGCGGSSKTASGTAIAPKTAPAFVSIVTDRTSPQWKHALDLIKRFPGGATALSQPGANAVLGAVGPEVDLVWFDFQNGGSDVVGLTKPKDAAKLDAALAKNGTAHTVIEGWTAFASNQLMLNRFQQARKNGSLSDDSVFKSAFDRLPKDSLAKVFIRGKVIQRRLQQSSTNSSLPVSSVLGKLDSIGAALVPASTGVKLNLNLNGSLPGSPTAFTPTLASSLPSGALAYVGFSNLEPSLKSALQRNPRFARVEAQLETLGGFSIQKDLLPLFAGEGAVAVYPATPQPGVLLVFRISDETAAKRVLSGVAKLVHLSNRLGVKTVHGVTELQVSPTTKLFVTVAHSKLTIATDPRLLGTPTTTLADDPRYKAALQGSGLPASTSTLVYFDTPVAVRYLLAVDAQQTHRTVNPAVLPNLAPLQGLVLHAEKNGGNYDLTGFLGIK